MCTLGKENSTYKKQSRKEKEAYSGNSKCLIRRRIAYKVKVARNNIRKITWDWTIGNCLCFTLDLELYFKDTAEPLKNFGAKNYVIIFEI